MMGVIFDISKVVFILALGFLGMKACADSDWMQESHRAAAAQEAADATPHVIREADGCKVYAFKSGDRFHYFTRCGSDKTTTESSWTVNCGKNCRREETETISQGR